MALSLPGRRGGPGVAVEYVVYYLPALLLIVRQVRRAGVRSIELSCAEDVSKYNLIVSVEFREYIVGKQLWIY
jgi:hypothetical protein